MQDVAISVRAVSKCYRVYEDQRSRLRHAIWPTSTYGMQEVWALRDVSFDIARGESVAIVGRNGGGKSTLLEILTGTLQASSGEVKVNGRVSALLELGSGFDPECTGRDNVILNGLLLGLRKGEILDRFGEIEEFAEIGAAMDRPVKTYSSGMMMRLAFAVQVIAKPDILIVDEALSVGDFFFQQKCLSHIRKLCDGGTTLLFVSHDMSTVRDLCSRAIYLSSGNVAADGDVGSVMRQFLAGRYDMSAVSAKGTSTESAADVQASPLELRRVLQNPLWRRTGTLGGAGILGVAVFCDNHEVATAFAVGDWARICVAYQPGEEPQPQVSISLVNKFDQTIFVTGTYHLGCELSTALPIPKIVVFEARVNLALEAGLYSLDVNLGRIVAPNQGYAVDKTPRLGPLSVAWDYGARAAPFLGMFGLQSTGRLINVQD